MNINNKYIIFLVSIVLIILMVGCEGGQSDIEENTPEVDTETVTEPVVEEIPTEEEIEPDEAEVVEVVEPTYGGHINIAMENPETLNPLLNTLKTVDEVLKLVYEPLFQLDSEGVLEPVLVESYTYDLTKSAITITLKDQIYFHNGEQLTTEDVRYSINTIIKNKGIYSTQVEMIDYVDVVDPLTMIIYFKEHYSYYLYDLTFPIVSSVYIESEEYDPMHAVGSGMYQVDSLTQMQSMHLSHYKNYPDKTPYVETIECLIIRNEEAENNAFDQHLVDIYVPSVLDWRTYSELNVTTHEYTTQYIETIGFNYMNQLCQDRDFRKAIAYAIDRETMVTNQFLDHGVIVDSFVHPIFKDSAKEDTYFSVDTSLAETYFTNWKAPVEPLKLIVQESNEIRVNMAEMTAFYLEALGVSIEVLPLNQEDFMSALEEGAYDLVAMGWKMPRKPDYLPLLHSVHGTYNMTHYANEEMDILLEAMYKSGSDDQFYDFIEDFEALCLTEMPYIPICYVNSAVISDSDVFGGLSPNAENVYEGIENLYVPVN